MTDGEDLQEPVVITRPPAAAGAAQLAGLERDTVLLTAHERRWPRRRVTSARGRIIVLALPPGQAVEPGAVLHAGAGWYLGVEAALEPVLVVQPHSSADAVRIAHAVGGHHGALAFDGERLLVPDEPAMERLLSRLAVPWTRAHARFIPAALGTSHGSGG